MEKSAQLLGGAKGGHEADGRRRVGGIDAGGVVEGQEPLVRLAQGQGRVRRGGRHLGEQAAAEPDRIRPEDAAERAAHVRGVGQHAAVAGALGVLIHAQAGGDGEAIAGIEIQLAEDGGAALLGPTSRIVGVHEEAGVEPRREHRRRCHRHQIQGVGQHVVAAVVLADVAAGTEQEVHRAAQAGPRLELRGPELGGGIQLVVAEGAVLLHRQDAAAGNAGSAVDQVAGARQPLRAGAASRGRDRPRAGGIAGRGRQRGAHIHRVVLLREVLAVAGRASEAQLQAVQIVVDAKRPQRFVVLEHRLEIRVHLAEAVQRRARIVVQRRVPAIHAERQRPGQGGEDTGRGGTKVRLFPAEGVRQAAGGRQGVAGAHLVGDAGAVVVFAEHAVEQPGAYAIRDLPSHGAAQRQNVAPVHVVVDAGEGVAVGIRLAGG